MSRRTEHVFEPLDSVSDWTVLGNDTINLATTTRCVSGSVAMEFDKVDGAANTKLAGAYRSFSPALNLRDVSIGASPADSIQWFVYVSSVANVDYAFIRLGTDASNYVEYRFDDSKLTAGEFTRCYANLYNFKAEAGTRCNFTSIAYMVVGVAFDAETNALADIAIDDVSLFTAMSSTHEAQLNLEVQKVANEAAAEEISQVGGIANAAAVSYGEGDAAALSTNLAGETRVVAESTEGTSGSAVPARMSIVGSRAETTIPTAVDDGDAVHFFLDEYGRLTLKAHVESSGSLAVENTSAAPREKFGPDTKAALTGAGSTAAVECHGCGSITWSFVVASLEASQFCVVRAEAQDDGTNWYNMDALNSDLTITANGNYALFAKNRAHKKTRFTLVTDSVGGAVTVTATCTAGR